MGGDPQHGISLLCLRSHADNGHGAVDAERVDGGAGQVLVLHDRCDLGRGDEVLYLGSCVRAEYDGAVIAPVRRVGVGDAKGGVGHDHQGQQGVGPKVASSRGMQRRPEPGMNERTKCPA